MKTIANLPSGFVTVIFGNDKGILEAGEGKGKDRVVIRTLDNVLLPFPVTEDAQEFAASDADMKVTDVEGVEYKLAGTMAVFGAEWKHAAEAIRGMLRARNKDGSWKYTDEQIREYASKFLKVAGRESMGVAPLTDKDLETDDIEVLKALIRQKGLVKNA